MKFSALKRASLAVFALALIAIVPARADEWSKTYQLTGRPDLQIETSDANIRGTTWEQNPIKAKVVTTRYKIGEDGIRVEEHQAGNSVQIEVHYPHHGFNISFGSNRVDIIIQMPREGNVTLRTGDGKIDIAGLKGSMDLHTGDGSENLDRVEGKLHATTGDGHINASGLFDELELKTGDGNVEVRAGSGSLLNAGWRLETGDGSVSLEVPGNLAAAGDLHTNHGQLDLDMPVTTSGKIRQNEIQGKLNGGGNLLIIRT